jgi:Ca2+-binding RTX toxin-like protein
MGSVAGAAKDCTITGSAADDILTGTTRADVICTGAGSDEAGGLEGNDVIRGGQGDDSFLTGDEGNDVARVSRTTTRSAAPTRATRSTVDRADDYLGGGASSNCYRGWNMSADSNEGGNDFLKSRDNVSGNDSVDGGDNTDTCVVDAGDFNADCAA